MFSRSLEHPTLQYAKIPVALIYLVADFHRNPSSPAMMMPPNYILSERGPPYILPTYFSRPLAFPKASIAIPHWKDLSGVSPANLFFLRSWIGIHDNVPELCTEASKDRIRASDMAWLISGIHKDGNHEHNSTTLHPQMGALFQQTKGITGARVELNKLFEDLQSLMFDAVCHPHSIFNTYTDYSIPLFG